MIAKKAYRKDYGFLSSQRAEKYSLFLKQNLLKLNPKYYVVIDCKRVTTPDGVMHAVRITTDLECPFEPIAECWINGSDIYLWRDKCWGIAINEKGHEVKRYNGKNGVNLSNIAIVQNIPINKTVLLFPIGIDEVE